MGIVSSVGEQVVEQLMMAREGRHAHKKLSMQVCPVASVSIGINWLESVNRTESTEYNHPSQGIIDDKAMRLVHKCSKYTCTRNNGYSWMHTKIIEQNSSDLRSTSPLMHLSQVK